jgi:hypothetical protein
MADHSRLINSTIKDYIKGREDAVMRNRKIFAMLNDKGRVTFNHSGTALNWGVRYKRAPMQGFADSDTLTFSRRDRIKRAELDWRGYAATDSITKMEKEKNKGAPALIKIVSEMVELLMDDVEDQFGDELFIDGNASGNSKRIHGLESFFSVSGVASTLIGINNDTYAGLSTTLGNYGGAWSGTWPTGTGDAHYDFWTPLVVDYEDGDWAASTKTWPNTCLEALRYGIIKVKKNKSKKGLSLITLNDELYRGFLDKLQAEEHINVQRGNGSSGLLSLGFSDITNFDGVDVTSEYGVPATIGYGVVAEEMELCSLQSQLFVSEGPDFDIASQSDRISIDFMGNLKCKTIRGFVKWDDIT